MPRTFSPCLRHFTLLFALARRLETGRRLRRLRGRNLGDCRASPDTTSPPFPSPSGKTRANATAQNPCKRRKHDNKRTFMRQRRKNQVPSFLSFFFFQVNAFGGFFLPSTHHTDKMHEHNKRRRTFLSRVFARLHNDATIYRRRPRRTRRRRP